jgi:hypothetical protein
MKSAAIGRFGVCLVCLVLADVVSAQPCTNNPFAPCLPVPQSSQTAPPSQQPQSGSNYDMLKRDNPYGTAEQGWSLSRLSQSVEVARLGITVFQSRAADGHGLVVIDAIQPNGPLGKLQLPPAVVINAVDTYHPSTIDLLMQIMMSHQSGDFVKLELMQFGPPVRFGEIRVRLN